MVSLSRSINTNAGGATFFSESGAMEDREYLQPILASFGMFKPLRTHHFFGVHLVATLALNIATIVFTVLRPDERFNCREYYALIYSHVGLWVLTLILDQYARVKHYALRMNGYLEFYKQTQIHHRLPFYTVSLINTALMFVQAFIQHFYQENFTNHCLRGGIKSPVGYLCLLTTFELLLVAFINISYIVRVRRFNVKQPPPDVQKEEWNACSAPENFAQGEIGYRQLGDKVYDFLEKQADLIRYLKDHNAKLAEKLMVVNAQLQARGRSEA